MKTVMIQTKLYRTISEASIGRFLTKHSQNGYVIVSANRSEKTPLENKKRDATLKSIISNSGWSYTPIYGGFIETNTDTNEKVRVIELSFIIYNFNRKNKELTFEDLKQFAIEIGKQFDQQAVLICPPGEAPYYCDGEGTVTMQFKKEMSIRDLTQDFFSSLSRSKRNIKRNQFTFKMAECCIKYPSNIMMRHQQSLLGEAIPNYLN